MRDPDAETAGQPRSVRAEIHDAARALGKLVFALAGLYAVTVTLLSVAHFEMIAHPRKSDSVSLDPLPELEPPHLEASGTAEPGTILEVGINFRPIGIATVHWDGRFSYTAEVGRDAERVWVRARDPKFQSNTQAEGAIHWKRGTHPRALDVCWLFPERKQLWVAGRFAPKEMVRLAVSAQGAGTTEAWADEFGVFDVLIPSEDAEADGLSVRLADAKNVPPLSCRVLRPGEKAPVSRHLRFDQREDPAALASEIAALSRSDPGEPFGKIYRRLLGEAQFEITLPVAHPFFQALAQGSLSVLDFVRGTFGQLAHVLREDYLDDWDADAPSSMRASLVDLKPKIQIEIRGESATVRTGLRFRTAHVEGEVRFQPHGDGLGSQPLLTDGDSVSLEIGEFFIQTLLPGAPAAP